MPVGGTDREGARGHPLPGGSFGHSHTAEDHLTDVIRIEGCTCVRRAIVPQGEAAARAFQDAGPALHKARSPDAIAAG